MAHAIKRTLIAFLVVAIMPSAALVGCASRSAPLAVGQPAPDVVLQDQTGTALPLASFRGQPLLVYFYPKDSTPGCTKEACAFRDVWARYESANVAVVGVSADSVASHAAFAAEHNLPFPLLADTEAALAQAFGLKGRLGMLPRVSFLIDGDGVVRAVYPDVDPGVHAEEVLADVTRLGLTSAP